MTAVAPTETMRTYANMRFTAFMIHRHGVPDMACNAVFRMGMA